MKKQGNIVREPGDGPGLLMIEGRQYQFSLDGVWQSEAPPRSGQLVEVELRHESAVTAITPVPESHPANVSDVPARDLRAGRFARLVTKLRASIRAGDRSEAERNSEETENS
jgi:hypothetical protein